SGALAPRGQLHSCRFGTEGGRDRRSGCQPSRIEARHSTGKDQYQSSSAQGVGSGDEERKSRRQTGKAGENGVEVASGHQAQQDTQSRTQQDERGTFGEDLTDD